MKSTIDMARESWIDVYGLGHDRAKFIEALKHFECLVRADEREQALAAPVQEPVATIDSLEQEIYENTREFVSLNVMEWLLNRLNTTPPAAQPARTLEELYAISREVSAAQPAPVQEPLAWAMFKRGRLESFWMDRGDAYDYKFTSEHEWKPLYTTPPAAQRTWVGLTDEEITDIWAEASPYYHEDDFARAIEAKLKEKNT
jgi:hypothetical protein